MKEIENKSMFNEVLYPHIQDSLDSHNLFR